jgi:hypothetical protein
MTPTAKNGVKNLTFSKYRIAILANLAYLHTSRRCSRPRSVYPTAGKDGVPIFSAYEAFGHTVRIIRSSCDHSKQMLRNYVLLITVLTEALPEL